MLTPQQVEEHLTRITYKPGFTFTYRLGRWEGPHLTIGWQERDAFAPADDPDRMVALSIECFLSPNDIATAEALETYLLYRLARIEVHECREFFKRDGKVVNSPHKPHADRDLT